jgi:hypothetical protein
MPVTDADPDAVRRTLQSLRRQSAGWSLTVVTVEEGLTALRGLIRKTTSLRHRRRIHILGAERSAPRRDLLRVGLEAGRGLPRALLFPGDVWSPDAVALLTAALTATSVVYADEDEVRPDGTWAAPRFKPDFSPEFLLTSAYVGRPLAMGANVADQLPALVASDATALEHECALAATDAADTVVHIPEVLCHRTTQPAPLEEGASVHHIREVLRRRGNAATVEVGPTPDQFTIVRAR